MRTSKEVDQILPAIIAVKAKLEGVKKGSNNPFFKSKYADLNSHLDVVEPLLQENGLILLQPVTVNEITGSNVVSSIIINKDGQFISSEMTLLLKDNDMQKLGSAVTYARRYTLGALLSMQNFDDDGNAASDKAKEVVKVAKTSPVQLNGTLPATSGSGPVTSQGTEQGTTVANKPSFRKPKNNAGTQTANQTVQDNNVMKAQIQSNGDDI